MRRFMHYLFSCNLSEIVTIFVAIMAGLPLPLTPLMLLWHNLINDVFPAFALAFEPSVPGVMRRPPRDPRLPLLSTKVTRAIVSHSALLGAVTLVTYAYSLWVLRVTPATASTIAFATLGLSQLFHVWNARVDQEAGGRERLPRNPYVWGALAFTSSSLAFAVHFDPLQPILGTTDLDSTTWGLVVGASLVPVLLVQAARHLRGEERIAGEGEVAGRARRAGRRRMGLRRDVSLRGLRAEASAPGMGGSPRAVRGWLGWTGFFRAEPEPNPQSPFEERVAREIMMHRMDIVAVPEEATLAQAVDLVMKEGYSRLPVYRGSLDQVVGVLHVKDLLRYLRENRTETMAGELMRPVLYVPETKWADELLRDMRHMKIHLAIVLDEYGGTAGLVTIEDVLEEIVGEIRDEYDMEEAEPVVILDARTALVDGQTRVEDVNERLQIALPVAEEVDTVGGLVLRALGRIPLHGEELAFDGVVIRVEELDGRRIARVRVEKGAAGREEADEPG